MYNFFFNHSVVGEGMYALGEEEKRFILSIPMYSCSFFFFLTLLFYFFLLNNYILRHVTLLPR